MPAKRSIASSLSAFSVLSFGSLFSALSILLGRHPLGTVDELAELDRDAAQILVPLPSKPLREGFKSPSN
ncbi:MAG TPA: hypothetical protein VIN39_08150 [Candidatus Dormibacteraeota bacterium]